MQRLEGDKLSQDLDDLVSDMRDELVAAAKHKQS